MVFAYIVIVVSLFCGRDRSRKWRWVRDAPPLLHCVAHHREPLLPPLRLRFLSLFIFFFFYFYFFIFFSASVSAAVQVEPPPLLGGWYSSVVACAIAPTFGCGMSLKLRSHGRSCARVGECSSTRLQGVDPDPDPARPSDQPGFVFLNKQINVLC